MQSHGPKRTPEGTSYYFVKPFDLIITASRYLEHWPVFAGIWIESYSPSSAEQSEGNIQLANVSDMKRIQGNPKGVEGSQGWGGASTPGRSSRGSK